MARVEFVPNTAAIEHFKSWQGTLGRAFGRLEKETVFRQKALAHVKTGTLRGSITSKRTSTSTGLQFESGSWTVTYAAVHELGSRPHKIEARNAPFLAFFWPKVGKFVRFKSVNHPGTKPYHYLSEGMARAMRMWERGG